MNKDKFSWFLKKFFFIHPVAIILIFIINSYELVRFNEGVSGIEIITSIIITIIFLILSYFGFKILLKNNYNAAILTSFFFLSCFFFLDITNFFYSSNIVKVIVNTIFFHKLIITFVLILITLLRISYLGLKRNNKSQIKFTWFLNVITIIFFVLRISQFFQANHINISLSNNDKFDIRSNKVETPNMYYIILDSYTSNRSLKQYWNFDNSEFTNYLKERGFYITNSNSNYNLTPFSLASSLNMSYLVIDRKNDIVNEHINDLFKLIKNSQVVNFLKNNKYEILNYSFFDISNQSKLFKNYFFLNNKFFTQSIFSIFFSKISEKWKPDELTNLPANNLAVVNKFKNFSPDYDKHYFIYAHLLLPHYPYFFDHNGKLMSTQYANDAENKMKYLEQLRYTNKIIRDCIENILNHSQSKPIIIIQGDHGFRYLKHKDQRAESFTILNAYYFPDHNYYSLYDSMSPVNSFRIVFNKYFNSNFPLLRDSSIDVLHK